jgi:alpha-D-ribose 1-methylphosphonate 5-triphosphate synthase subunit PhnH
MTLQLTKKHSFDAVYDSQKVYRLILEAMSNPGHIVNIQEYADKLYGGYPTFLAVAMTLLDNEVSFHVCGNHPFADEIASLTLAKKVDIENADFIFTSNPNVIECAIENAKYGTLTDPHKSATVIIQNDGKPNCRLTLSGPGINGQIEVATTQIAKDAVAIRDAQNYEYPQGIDLLFISGAGELLAIPRLVAEV